MLSKVLVSDPKKCTGCNLCEFACSLRKDGECNPAKSRIRIIDWNNKGLFLPIFCQQCEDGSCMAACPKGAIYRDYEMNRVMVDYDRCISCKMCISACPFGAIGFDEDRGKVIRCDLCDGDPQCVRFCDSKALSFIDTTMLSYPNVRKSARNFTGVKKAA
ncbi:MAG: 4Fe-4S dicluster domain-containing protein [Deltaproteobacteria bacterium]|nr:4Fe-4S dicluster domain-containing protein [Deltaproteobacteria bacterium]MBW2563243.1 4Fe-4S dicluster domain-containing protein [Deltaproteobacteria bacterium]